MITRRRFLVGAAGTGALVATSAVLSACGSTAPLPSPTAGRPAPSPMPPTASPTPQATAAPTPQATATPAPPVVLAPPVRRADYPVLRENRRPGTSAWEAGTDGLAAAEGYISKASVEPGETFTLHVGSDAGPVDVAWYRLGWYDGTGARLVRRDHVQRPVPAIRPRADHVRGIVEAGWDPAIELTAGKDWTSGSYVAVLRPAHGSPGHVPFTVRPHAAGLAGGPAPILFVSAAATWQAYNGWGQMSLYDYNSSGIDMPPGTNRALTVSFDRPHLRDQGTGLAYGWEIQFVRWQERQLRDVAYVADVDLELHPELIAGRRLLVFAGHHEYWSLGMRQTLERAIAAGTNVLFLSANELYWQVRFEPSALGPARRMVCYKTASLDPMATVQPSLTTCTWRSAPVGRPEAAVVGQMYAHVVKRSADWRVANAGHWLYGGTGLRDGDRIVNLVGQEYDTFRPELAPPGTILLARSPVKPNCVDPSIPELHTATMYTAPSGATVFAAGTFQWSWALDSYGSRDYLGIRTPLDKRVSIMTANLFNRLGDGPA